MKAIIYWQIKENELRVVSETTNIPFFIHKDARSIIDFLFRKRSDLSKFSLETQDNQVFCEYIHNVSNKTNAITGWMLALNADKKIVHNIRRRFSRARRDNIEFTRVSLLHHNGKLIFAMSTPF